METISDTPSFESKIYFDLTGGSCLPARTQMLAIDSKLSGNRSLLFSLFTPLRFYRFNSYIGDRSPALRIQSRFAAYLNPGISLFWVTR